MDHPNKCEYILGSESGATSPRKRTGFGQCRAVAASAAHSHIYAEPTRHERSTKKAFQRLGSLTELGRIGRDPSPQRCPALEMLALYRTSISDEGLQHLHGLKQLRLLVIGETNVTPKGKKLIKQAIPTLKVVDYEGIYCGRPSRQ